MIANTIRNRTQNWVSLIYRLVLLPIVLTGFVMVAIGTSASAQERDKAVTVDRARAQAIIDNLRKITGDNGIDTLKTVELGGIDQWISVRGQDRANPILLFIHGGPAVPEMPGSWFYQRPWEDYFTVVQWDQRGAGKSITSSNPEAIAATITVDQMVADAGELVAHLRRTYRKRKIFVLGHSWGSIIGLRLAMRHPDWLYAYIGMGQGINAEANERLGTEWVLRQAEAPGNKKAENELRGIMPYPEPGKPLDINKVLVQRKWLTYFGGMTWNRSDLSFQQDAAILSPDYTGDDLAARDKAGVSAMALLPEIAKMDFSDVTELDCPVFILAGEHDHATSSVVAKRWLANLSAPQKHFIRFEGVAHEIQFEAPGKLFFHLVHDIRPLAEKAEDEETAH